MIIEFGFLLTLSHIVNSSDFSLPYQCQSVFNALSFHPQRRNDFLYCENADTHQKKIHVVRIL